MSIEYVAFRSHRIFMKASFIPVIFFTGHSSFRTNSALKGIQNLKQMDNSCVQSELLTRFLLGIY